MTTTPEWACWLDLETAGSNETLDPILEVGAVLCRNEPGMPIEHDGEFSSLLRQRCGGNHVALAGSGVGHFDRRFIRAQMPRTDKRFTYWAYDLGVIRRLFDRVHPDLVRPLPAGGKAHRGLADALDHRAEWLHYEALLTENGAAA